jgi:hypothetical protein
MTIQEHKKHIDKVLEKTFSVIRALRQNKHFEGNIVCTNVAGSRLIFPKKRNGEVRVSEQELRFVFQEQFYAYINDLEKNGQQWDVFYSVETPTLNEYSLSGNGKRSANIDLAIYAEGVRIAIIEFKALNPGEYEHMKDTFKLRNEPGDSLRYFVEIVASRDSGTFPSIERKLVRKDYEQQKFAVSEAHDNKFTYVICCLTDSEIISEEVI